jgi:hypothetical protein
LAPMRMWIVGRGQNERGRTAVCDRGSMSSEYCRARVPQSQALQELGVAQDCLIVSLVRRREFPCSASKRHGQGKN